MSPRIGPPREVTALSGSIFRSIEDQVLDEDGVPDWRRVTVTNGEIIIHNKPVRMEVVHVPNHGASRRIQAHRRAAAATPQPAPAGGLEPASTPNIPSPIDLAARLSPPKPPVLSRPQAPAVPHFQAPASPAVTRRRPSADRTRPTASPLPAEVDPDITAYQASIELSGGIPVDVPITIADWVVDWPEYDADIVDAVLVGPDRVEVDPQTATKGYPVLRFWRADVCVIVMLPPNAEPFVPTWYASSKAMDRWSGPRSLAGVAGSRRSVGMPRRPGELIKRLQKMGAQVVEIKDDQGGLKGRVLYMGQEMGEFRIDGAVPHETELNWQRLSRKVHGAYQRYVAGKLSSEEPVPGS